MHELSLKQICDRKCAKACLNFSIQLSIFYGCTSSCVLSIASVLKSWAAGSGPDPSKSELMERSRSSSLEDTAVKSFGAGFFSRARLVPLAAPELDARGFTVLGCCLAFRRVLLDVLEVTPTS